jgi:hypothetical protein
MLLTNESWPNTKCIGCNTRELTDDEPNERLNTVICGFLDDAFYPIFLGTAGQTLPIKSHYINL